MWENHADARIMAAIENVYLDYYLRKDNAYEKENDSAFVVATHPLPAGGKECIRVFGPILGGCESGGIGQISSFNFEKAKQNGDLAVDVI